MAIQTFTAGQILTAAQMNSLQANDYNQTVSTKTASYVLVAADKGTRIVMNSASATTITVNTSLFAAGDTLYLQNIGAGVCTVTAGTATVTSAGPLAIPQWGSGTLYFTSASAAIYFPSAVTVTTPGMVRIVTSTVSAQSTVTLTNVFSATYHSYLITLSNMSGTDTILKATLGATATGYSYGGREWKYNAASADRFASNTTYIEANVIGTAAGSSSLIYVQNPFLSITTTFQTMQISNKNDPGAIQQQGFLNNTTSYTDMVFTMTTGTFSGTITAYGLAQS